MGKLPNYAQHFGSNIVEGVADSWVEVEMSWVEADGAGWRWMKLGGGGWSCVEVGARFSNTRSKLINISVCISCDDDTSI